VTPQIRPSRKRPIGAIGLSVATIALVGAFALSFVLPDRGKAAPPPVDIEGAFRLASEPVGPPKGPLLHPVNLRLEAPPATSLERVEVARGDTLMNLLVKAGAERSEAHAAITALQEVYDPRDLRPGQELFLTFASTAGQTEEAASADLLAIAFRPTLVRDIEVKRTGEDSFDAQSTERPLQRQLRTSQGEIESSLAVAGDEAAVPPNILIEAIRAFSFDVDFQREIQKGDGFEFFYEIFRDPEGRIAKTGELLYGALVLSGKRIEYYFYEDAEGGADYFDASGQSVRKALMRTPIDGARISSGFGKRRHPISGYTKMHRGTDFAAPRGTPIYAAGKGKVEAAGRNGGYGIYVRIRHNSTYKTAYAHMKAIARGVKRGAWVRQGQVIGYVGSTGRSTGPHLHYEIHKNGKQVNPLKVRLPSGEKLKGERLARFQKHREEIDRLRENFPPPVFAGTD
jgi:murein DD-endopeptidase MepM/ murein hydrolase activator NlpD